MVTKTGCEVLTRFPAEELVIAGTRYYTSAGPLPATREIQAHLNRPGGVNHLEAVTSGAANEGGKFKS